MTSPSPWLAVAVAAALGLACQPQGGESTAVFTTTPPTSSTADGSTGEPGSSAGTTETADASATEPTTSTTSTASSGASTYDVGSPDLGDGRPIGCQGKIDFVFVISRTPSMKGKQEALIASFPGFAETISTAFADFDYHILFPLPTTFWGDIWDCPIGLKGCYSVDEPCAGLDEPAYPCWAHFTKDTLGPCDSTQGAGIVFPAGLGATNHPCEFAGGKRYIQKDEPDLAAAFACAAQGGFSSGGTAQAWTTVQALAPEMNEPGGCNDGFLRDDALLVIVLITDLDDLESPYNPLPWAQMVQSAKGGRKDGVVFLGLLGDDELPPSEQYCMINPNPQEARLVTWMKYFAHYKWASVCLPDYTGFFAEAAEYVLDSCAVYVPQ
ncbi:MAG: hypothetical protein R3B09_01770 [Nannocystaceae bacterium]